MPDPIAPAPTSSPKQRRTWARRVLWLLLFLVVGFAILLVFPWPLVFVLQHGANFQFNRLHSRFSERISKSTGLVIYEGLPHQRNERQLLADELARVKTVQLGGFPFYQEPSEVDAKDAVLLNNIYTRSSTFAPRLVGLYKKCGGYHPDYCLAWSDGTKTNYVQICFGCHEMKTFSGGSELYCDIQQGAYDELKQILVRYQKNRPRTQFSPQ